MGYKRHQYKRKNTRYRTPSRFIIQKRKRSKIKNPLDQK